jgi:hypothetical protein
MKKIVLSLLMAIALISVNAQDLYVKYEYMKVLPGQDYEKMEQSWINYHKEQMKAGIINLHRVWKVLPGNEVDYDYVVTTVYNNYQDALGLGKTISIDEFKSKYPEDYQVMYTTTLKTRTMVREAIVLLQLGLSEEGYSVVPGQTLMSMEFIREKNSKYNDAEKEFSAKWHQYLVDSKNKIAFNLMQRKVTSGSEVSFSHLITNLYKNIDQLNKKVDMTKFKMTPQDNTKLNQLVSYRDITKTVLHVNVMNLEK